MDPRHRQVAPVVFASVVLVACATVDTLSDGSHVIRGDTVAVDRKAEEVCGVGGGVVEPLEQPADPTLGTHVSPRGVAANCAGNNLCLMTMHGTTAPTGPEKSVRVVCR